MTAAKDEAVANAAKRQVLAPPTKAAITRYVTLIHSSWDLRCTIYIKMGILSSIRHACLPLQICEALAYEVVCTLCGSVEVDMHVQCKQTLAELKAQHAEEIARMDELSDA